MMDSTSIRLTNVRIVDGTGGNPIECGEVTVADGRFSYVGQLRENWTDIGATKTIDGSGWTVLPGFIDAHIHATLEIEENPRTTIADAGSYASLKTAQRLRRTLEAGITTIRDLGGLDHGMQRALDDGLILGPRARIALKIISPTGGHADLTMPNGELMPLVNVPTFTVADSDQEVITTVRTLIRSGANLIKVTATGGVTSPTGQPDDLGVTEDQIALIGAELERHSQPRHIAAHAQGAAGVVAAVRGGVDSIEHGYQIDDQGIDLMLERGTYLVPTLSTALRIPDQKLVPSYLYEKKVRWSQIARENLAKAFDAGVTVALGTDAGICPHGRNLLELAHMVELGLSPSDAIVAGTANAAGLLGIDDELGTLEVGKVADLVAVSVDPLTDIAALASPDAIELVIKDGVVVKDLTVEPAFRKASRVRTGRGSAG